MYILMITWYFISNLSVDELFGRSNFRSFITRRKCNPKNYTRRQYGNVSDYILFYTKSNQYIWNRPHHDWTDELLLIKNISM
jgi:adenine-specific DNA-methyltransferase